jgi:hypothetical protein
MKHDQETAVLLSTARVKAMLGDVSDMFVNRRVAETEETLRKGGLDAVPDDDASLFPLPRYVGTRRFWQATHIKRWMAALPSKPQRRVREQAGRQAA